MGEKSSISWTMSTWNPRRGCRKISSGCKHCYMFRQQKRYGRDPRTIVRSKTTFHDPLKWKEPRLIFTCSLSDWFLEEADEWRTEAWDIIKHTPQHTYQILTKRPARILCCLPADWGEGWKNVWMGVSAENQAMADLRIPVLLDVPAAVRFVSLEPLLGPIDLRQPGAFSRWKLLDETSPSGKRLFECRVCGRQSYFPDKRCQTISDPDESHGCSEWRGISWVIAGGESGPNHRPMQMAWARSIRDQCVAAGVPFFFKQQAANKPETNPFIVERDGSHTTWQQLPEVPEPEPTPRQQSLFGAGGPWSDANGLG